MNGGPPIGVFGDVASDELDAPEPAVRVLPAGPQVHLSLPDRILSFPYHPGWALARYLALAGVRTILSRMRAYDDQRLDVGPLRARYVVPAPTTILFTRPGVSPILMRFQRLGDGPPVTADTPSSVEMTRVVGPTPDPWAPHDS